MSILQNGPNYEMTAELRICSINKLNLIQCVNPFYKTLVSELLEFIFWEGIQKLQNASQKIERRPFW